ncbi:MAG: S8/S53 family peptidase [Candidatus Omnitrophica bacterium]|nr:S8/S53 family peptidase [Candidatus Omnitrophota bacterium]MBU4488990.1 S8/S53 family peptidase [Candidatus Omnitrophota bacterium]
MKKRGFFISIVFLCLVASSSAFAENQQSSTEAYLQELQSQGKERVIVIFKDDAVVDPSLVEKYNGTIIRAFSTSKALVCEIPQENIELIKQEETIKGVTPDILMELPEGGKERDPEELALFNRFKKEYFQRIKGEYRITIKQMRREYLTSLRELFMKRKTIIRYAKLLDNYRRKGRTKTPAYYTLVAKRNKLLREYYAEFRRLLGEYRSKLSVAKDVYAQTLSGWREEVDEMVALSYTGTVTVRWNNLEAGLNSQAAWDNYNLDGTGIKIAIIDMGVNYTLENLNDHYLGGYDFVYNDTDPMPHLDQTEDHGTGVASIAVGEGVNQIVGVAYNASYYSVRIGESDAQGFLLTNLISGIEWASTEPHKADIISMSVGSVEGGIGWEQLKTLMENACNNAYNNGVILVAASGNDGGINSNYPARFDNVISAGGHAEDQTLLDRWIGQNHIVSNGGADIVAPAERVYVVGADNSVWLASGTSAAAPHVAGLLALQLQYARQHNIDVNNGYLWESIKHSAKDMPLITDPNYEGSGKIWAAETNPPPPAPNKGSVDLMSSSIWPFDVDFEYLNYIFLDQGLYPAYYIGTNMYQDITLTNLTDIEGNTPETIENLNVTTIQKYCDTGEILPGSPTENFASYEPITLSDGTNIILQDTYYIPWAARPGLYKVVLDLEFKFAGNNRLMKITDNEASIWCPPAIINEGFPEQ